MLKIKKILFTTDFSESADQALPHVLFLAKKYQAKLDVLHVMVLHEHYESQFSLDQYPDWKTYIDSVEKSSNLWTDMALETFDTQNIDITKIQRRGFTAAPVILDYAKEKEIDLIVMGIHGRRGIEHFFLGSVAEEVVRLSSCPVLTLHEFNKPADVEKIERILVPVDFSKHSKKALLHAKNIAVTYKAKIQLLHVIVETVHPSFYATGETSIFKLMPQINTISESNLKKMFDETGGPQVDVDIHVVEGNAANEIIKFAEEQKSNMIVTATHGLTGLQHFFMGSVAEKVVRLTKCPVLTVKAYGKSLL